MKLLAIEEIEAEKAKLISKKEQQEVELGIYADKVVFWSLIVSSFFVAAIFLIMEARLESYYLIALPGFIAAFLGVRMNQYVRTNLIFKVIFVIIFAFAGALYLPLVVIALYTIALSLAPNSIEVEPALSALMVIALFISVFYAALSGVVLAIKKMTAKVARMESLVAEISIGIDKLQPLDPQNRKHQDACIDFARMLEEQVPEAIELKEALDRKPLLGEYYELERKVAERERPLTKEEQAKLACMAITGEPA